jgi:hypothetical protein
MALNFDDEDFDPSDFESGESDGMALEDIRREDERIKKLPVMIKAQQILEVTEALLETLPDDDMAEHYRRIMMEDALILAPKIAGAEGADIYTLRMENAVIIKVAARNLLTQTSGLAMMGLSETRYIQVLRDEIEEFRVLFISWIKTFNPKKDIKDNWGLFYD